MNTPWTDSTPRRQQERKAAREDVSVPARLTWKDQRGMTRFASVITRNVSELGVYVECCSPVSIPMYRLVHFQVEREGREIELLPPALRHGRTLSAVYRIAPQTPERRQGLALRLMVDPKRRTSGDVVEAGARATA